jgi:DNA-binding transcriptional MerR regulator
MTEATTAKEDLPAERGLRFSTVAYAIDTTPKSLRKWLQSGKVTLDSDTGTGWRAFTLYDVAILAIMRRLVDFGVGVEEAGRIARTPVATAAERVDLRHWFSLQSLVVIRQLDQGKTQYRFLRQKIRPRIGTKMEIWDVLDSDSEFDASLNLNLDRIVNRALDRISDDAALGRLTGGRE